MKNELSIEYSELETETIVNEDGWIFELKLGLSFVGDAKWGIFDIHVRECVNDRSCGTMRFKVSTDPKSNLLNEIEWAGRNAFYALTAHISGPGINTVTLCESIHMKSLEKIVKTHLASDFWYDSSREDYTPEVVWLS